MRRSECSGPGSSRQRPSRKRWLARTVGLGTMPRPGTGDPEIAAVVVAMLGVERGSHLP
jgi:hypothetical protein